MEQLGYRLKQLRELHNLSQRELARRSGVSNATISLIESNRTSPSLGMLKRILDAIPISISTFFDSEFENAQQVFFRAAELKEIGGGPISYRQVGQNLQSRRLQMLQERYEPGADTGQSMLTHDAEEAGIVLRGQLELTVGEETRILGPGDAYLFNSNIPHRFRNPGTEVCETISACTPPSF